GHRISNAGITAGGYRLPFLVMLRILAMTGSDLPVLLLLGLSDIGCVEERNAPVRGARIDAFPAHGGGRCASCVSTPYGLMLLGHSASGKNVLGSGDM
ncbi:MAG: hypothetical protein M0R02_10390, partial [Bacteroidales bacterium]|nr:hypothetical protein [Bacteroidales bacterium]